MNGFVGNVTRMITGGLLAQLIAIISIPFLTRLYTPEDFGHMGVWLGIFAIVSPLATLRYDLVLPLPEKEADAWSLFRWAVKVCLWISIAVFLFLWFVRIPLACLLDSSKLAIYLPLIGCLLFCSGWNNLWLYWGLRHKAFGLVAQTAVTSSLVGNVTKLVAGCSGLGISGLIVGTFLQHFAQGWTLRRKLSHAVPTNRNSGAPKTLLRRYQSFPRYRLPQDWFSALAHQLPNLILAAAYGPVMVGFYLLALRLVDTPIGLLSESVRQVFYPKAAEIHRDGQQLFSYVWKLSAGLILLTLPIIFLLVALGESIFRAVFGPEWAEASAFAVPLVIMVSTALVTMPVNTVVPVLDMNRQLLIYEVLSSILRLLVLLLATSYLSPSSAVWFYVLVSVLCSLIWLTWMFLNIKRL